MHETTSRRLFEQRGQATSVRPPRTPQSGSASSRTPASWSREDMVTADEILERLVAEFDLAPTGEHQGSAPAERFVVNGGAGTVGVIASVTPLFRGDSDRVRLTPDGQVLNCLFVRDESASAARSGAGRRTPRSPTTGGPSSRASAPAGPALLPEFRSDHAGRPRGRRPGLPAARPPDERDRRPISPRDGSARRPWQAAGRCRPNGGR
ncbi:hypothetical protein [Streptomyces sp. NPDC055140]